MKAFFAYPSNPNFISQCIHSAVDRLRISEPSISIHLWERNDIAGRPLTQPIIASIEDSDCVLADITRLNFNVVFEIGYSIARHKRVFLLRNIGIRPDTELMNKVGIFDTLGYLDYENSIQLERIIEEIDDTKPLTFTPVLNKQAPIFLIETPVRSDALLRISSRIKKSRLRYRSFNPSEDPRLSASFAIEQVANSYGVVVPLANLDERDASIHNMRAAFVAGLAMGMEKELLLLQPLDGQIYLDVRDMTKHYRAITGIDGHIIDFTYKVYDLKQDTTVNATLKVNRLASLVVGDPMAENEFTTLNKYYVQTDQFTRTISGEVNIVVGRKGTGKTALFAQVRDKIRSDKDNIVVDLKPEGYQLVKLKEEILKYATVGVQTHLLVTFWEYLLLMEIAYKILEKDQERHMRDRSLYDAYVTLNEQYGKLKVDAAEGDFSERLVALSDVIVSRYLSGSAEALAGGKLSPNVTELLRTAELREFKRAVTAYLKHKDNTWILFDNLDKGWASGGVTAEDTLIVRCLIDAMRRLQRGFQREDIIYYSVIFIRDDVFQWLMSHTSDFGKEMIASLDWTDRDLLKSMLMRRLSNGVRSKPHDYIDVWREIIEPKIGSQDSLEFFIDRSLMRPRNLLKLFSYCRGMAINMDHDYIKEVDVVKGFAAYSNDVLTDADNEMRDINPKTTELLFKFYRGRSEYRQTEIFDIFRMHGLIEGDFHIVLDILLYYGFLGVKTSDGEYIYIYNVVYDMRKLKVLMQREDDIVYCINQALHPALELRNTR